MRFIQRSIGALLLVSVFCIFATPVQAWMRPQFDDDEVVDRSELIVVGAIKDGSVRYVPHEVDKDRENSGRSWEHHATLVIRRVLKGNSEDREIPIVLHYGIEPLVNGQPNPRNGEVVKLRPAQPDGVIEIYDGGDHRDISIDDAREDNIWFLRRGFRHKGYRVNTGENDLGVRDPEDIQPLALRDYFSCYLSDDPEGAIRKEFHRWPAMAGRATRYLAHQDIDRSLKIADPALRVERLLPYFVGYRYGYWRRSAEIQTAILSAGDVAGSYLMGVYESSWDSDVRQRIIGAWGKLRWKPSVDLLIKLLDEREKFWGHQKLENGWWNADGIPERRKRRQDEYALVHRAVFALGQIGDPRARDAIERTRQQWIAIDFENKQIVEECERALKAMGINPSTAPSQ